MPYTAEELSKEALQPKIDEIKSNPQKLLEYKDDIQMFERLIQLLFNQSQLGLVIKNIEEHNSEQDLQLLYDLSYKYIPRKMNDKASEEAFKKTSEKTIQRLIKSKNNQYYSSLTPVNQIIEDKIDLYPLERYSQETLELLIKESFFAEKVFEKIISMLDENTKKSIENSISYSFIEQPYLLKYTDIELDDHLLVAIIGTAIRKNKLNEIEEILIQKNIPENIIKEIENFFFSEYNEIELDTDITFDE